MIQEAFDLAEVGEHPIPPPLLTSSTLGECAEVWLMKAACPGHAYRDPQGNTMFYSEAWQMGPTSASMGPRTPSLSFRRPRRCFYSGYEEEGCDALFFHWKE